MIAETMKNSAFRALFVCSAVALALDARAQSLPEGLTCGLSYLTDAAIVENNSCNGVSTLSSGYVEGECDSNFPACYLCNCIGPCFNVGCAPGATSCCDALIPGFTPQSAPGYSAVFDGDFGADPGRGFYHQRLTSGVTDPFLASSFVLPSGAVCGFHHTRNSPGLTCMGYNASQAYPPLSEDPPGPGPGAHGCPPGWAARRAFDMGSGYGYWTWCEYQDLNQLSWGGPTVQPLGVACGAAHNDSQTGTAGYCQGFPIISALYPNQPSCPARMAGDGLAWRDLGEPSNVGLGFCTLVANPLPPNAGEGTFPDCTCPAHCPFGRTCDSGVPCPTEHSCTCQCTGGE